MSLRIIVFMNLRKAVILIQIAGDHPRDAHQGRTSQFGSSHPHPRRANDPGLVARCERSGERRLACETFRDGQIDNATSDYHHELRNCISYEVMNLVARPLFKRWMSPGQTGYDALTPLLFQPISADKRDRRPSRRVSTGGLRASGDGLHWTRGASPAYKRSGSAEPSGPQPRSARHAALAAWC
jgi:hypothetical protein